MSVVVKGMRMPESCKECPFSDHEAWCLVPGNWQERYYCPDDCISDDCPLVDLGKHGDLIDRDEFKETLDYYIREAGWSDEINKALGWVKDDFINSEPTVIGAEDEG